VIALASLLVVILVSLLVTRVATVALVLTGLSREVARFQARSALSGVGFTTTEADSVVNHPVRRRIVMLLMLLGGAGTVTVLGTLVLSFAGAGSSERMNRVGVLVAGLFVLWLVARSAWVDRQLSRLIGRILDRWTDLPARDYAALLHLSGPWTVGELAVSEGDWVADRSLGELRLRDEGVVVLGITRAEGTFMGAPRFDTRLLPQDTLLVYGRAERIEELDRRPSGPQGDAMHEEAVEHHGPGPPRSARGSSTTSRSPPR
jgi:hypothetical protein